MADLLALQPNMAIRLHIVAPDDRGPLSEMCTFISYESVDAINSLEHLAHTKDGIIADYEEGSPINDSA
ncbi:MAG TPA: hypothetical protein VNW97_12545 [Candidatus Saccharimonadales bacterium]|jgi:hypothetical protein|nr:hypothetical protein [Candidatus Saccharimonadales bacterium]